jgi:hypothetical protein
MVTILEDKTVGDMIALVAEGKIEKADYDKVWPLVEQKVQEHGKIRVYVEVREIDMVTLRALYEEVKMDVKHFRDFSKAALVGDKTWKQMATLAVNFITSGEARYFDLEEKQQAWEWVSQPALTNKIF